ncbi:unnamed protein product [Rhizoctonia solani]|uniref:O-methylsterigmatocystin oxidoreductase n=1 Tax=Rhizoctonia solani TaxID=456999 RepID=A0A8H2WDF6_9AGAM|nr:unnamed protein product [Rhizoctonia solani]
MADSLVRHPVVPLSLTVLLLYQCWRLVRRSEVRHPPSPKSLPFVGNLFSVPPGHEHLAFAKIGEQLESDIVYLEILGQKILVLNSAEAASDLLDKRSGLYSDRPSIPMLTAPSLMNWSGAVTLAKYGDIWRSYRRIMNNWLNRRAVSQFDLLQERQARLLTRRLLSIKNHAQPFQDFHNELLFTIGSLMFQVAYGYEPQSPQDQFFKGAQLAFQRALLAGMQTNFLVNVFPAMLHIPSWFPGTEWKNIGREWRVQQERAKTDPYEWVKAEIASGTHQVSLLGLLLQDHELLSGWSPTERDERLKEIGAILFGAAMVLHPHAQARAQQELDAVLGHARLPDISDRERLPYMRNLIDEVLRLYPIVPLGLPHTCFQDDIYRGYNIEKGTVVMGNVWAISHDPHYYKDPEHFHPDRYLDPTVPRPPVFGWGRRKCPGIYFAEASAFINAASLLSVFTFSKKKDSRGEDIVPRIEIKHNAIIVEPKSFEFEFRPRSEEHHQLALGVNVDKEQIPTE